jgi:hypothetical protein
VLSHHDCLKPEKSREAVKGSGTAARQSLFKLDRSTRDWPSGPSDVEVDGTLAVRLQAATNPYAGQFYLRRERFASIDMYHE